MIIQRSPEWHELRRKKIGASDAPIIMGVSPYKTKTELWRDKMGFGDDSPKPWMEYGIKTEPRARVEAEKILGCDFMPLVVMHPTIDFMMASIDALSLDKKTMVEIKCLSPRSDDFISASKGKVPEKYYPQVQHQLEVLGLDHGFMFFFNDEGQHLLRVERDQEYINKMLDAEREFYGYMQSEMPPPDEKEHDLSFDPEVLALTREWEALQTEIDRLTVLKNRQDEIKQKLFDKCNQQNTVAGNVKITFSTRKGAVDYSLIEELKNIDLEKYRKSASTTISIRYV